MNKNLQKSFATEQKMNSEYGGENQNTGNLKPAIAFKTKHAEIKPAIAFRKREENEWSLELYADRECTTLVYPEESPEFCPVLDETQNSLIDVLVTENGLLIDDMSQNKPSDGKERAMILWKKIEELPDDYREQVKAAIVDGEINCEKVCDHEEFWNAIRDRADHEGDKQERVIPMGYGTEYEEWIPGFVKRGMWILACVDEEKGEYRKVCFCNIECIEVRDMINSRGERIHRYMDLKVSTGDDCQRFTIEMSWEGKRIEKLFRNVIGFETGHGVSFESNFKNMLSKLATLSPRTRILVEHGWQKINGKMIYVYDRRSDIQGYKVQCGKHILQNSRYTTLEIWDMAVSVFNQRLLAGPILLYSLYGISHRLFIEAQHRPTAILFLTGETGSMKTSISQVLFCMFNTDEDIPIIPFQSTPASLDPAIRDAKDAILLVDDYCPNSTTTKSGRDQMKQVLDRLIRIFGDGTARRKMDSPSKLAEISQASGGAVATGEIEAEGRSSCLRMITTQIRKKDINGEALQIFQEDKSIWSTFLARYISFLEANFINTVGLIATQYKELRKQSGNVFGERRNIDHYVECSIINTLLCNFLKDEGMTVEATQSTYRMLDEGLIYHISRSETLAKEQDPNLFILEAVVNVLTNGAISVADSEKEYDDNSDYSGYKKANYVYVEEFAFMDEVAKYLKSVLGNYTLDRVHLLKSLSSRYDIIYKFKNGYGKNGEENWVFKTKKNKLGKKMSIVAICLERAEDILDEQQRF